MSIRDLWDLLAPTGPERVTNWGEAISDAVDSGTNDLAGLTIVELSTGVWSGDAPARDPGVNPIEFRSVTDPADATNGITTPANINARDRWVELDSL